MCMFCVAIPATLALGANAQAHYKRLDKESEERGKPPSRRKVSPKAATAMAVAGLVVASIAYHTSQGA